MTIDLSTADLVDFEAYESTVLALLSPHGARLEARVRTIDGARETHLLFFPDQDSDEAYLAHPVRLAARKQFEQSGATAFSQEVVQL